MAPIQKHTADQFIKDDVHYDIISREAIQAVHSTDALAIWVYLQSKPETWVPRPSEIQKHFGIGRQRYLNGMKHLREAGLVTISRARDDKGKISGSILHCHAVPNHVPENRRSVEPTVGQTDGRSNGLYIETEILIETESIKETDSAFEEFWRLYDKPTGKKPTRERWDKLKKKEIDLIMDHVNSAPFKAWVSKNPRQYRPNPVTWLNQHRWNDELAAANRPNKKKRTTYQDNV
jgi:hypothetical protein